MATNGKVRVSAEDFIHIWQTSESREEVVDRLGQQMSTVITRSNNLRKAGVNLKKIAPTGTRGRKVLDVEGLNALIEQIA